jgi:dephospho-CoA kinase
MGKSTVAAMFVDLGCPVFDADAAVREFYQSKDAGVVEAEFPGVLVDGEVRRDRLAAHVLGDAAAMKRLEAIVHPVVAASRQGFLERARALGRRVAILDVPLLFETGGERNVDIVVVVSASAETQRARALARDGMTASKLDALLTRQTPDSEKRRRAHFVIDTDVSLEDTRAQAEAFVRAIVALPGRGIRIA